MKDNRNDELTYNDAWRLKQPKQVLVACDLAKAVLRKQGVNTLTKLDDWKFEAVAEMIKVHFLSRRSSVTDLCQMVDMILLILECQTEEQVAAMAADELAKQLQRVPR